MADIKEIASGILEKICEICMKPIVNPRPNQKVHTGNCQQVKHNRYSCERSKKKSRLKNPVIEKICPICLNRYETQRDARTCKDEKCKNKYQRIRLKEKFSNLPVEYKKEFYKKKYKKYSNLYKNRNYNYYGEKGQDVVSICPGCGKKHLYHFDTAWIGNGTPRIGCDRFPNCVNDQIPTDAILYRDDFSAIYETGNKAMI